VLVWEIRLPNLRLRVSSNGVYCGKERRGAFIAKRVHRKICFFDVELGGTLHSAIHIRRAHPYGGFFRRKAIYLGSVIKRIYVYHYFQVVGIYVYKTIKCTSICHQFRFYFC